MNSKFFPIQHKALVTRVNFCQFSRPKKDADLILKLDDQKEIKDFEVVNVQINDGDHEYSDFDDSDSGAEGCAHFDTFHEELTWLW